MRVPIIIFWGVGGFLLLSVFGVFGAETSSSSSIPSLEIVSINPQSPAILQAGQKVTVKVRYNMGECESIQIWVRSTRSSRGEISHPCPPIPRTNGQTGTMEGWFFFDDKAEAKEIKVVMKDVAKNAFIYEATKTVDYQWLSPSAQKAPEKFEGIARIPASFTWDIDSDTIGGNSKLVDLWWMWDSSKGKDPSLVTRNNAGMALLDIPFDQINPDQLRKCSFGQNVVQVSSGRYRVKPGLCLGVRTSEGHIAKLELLPDEYPKCLVFRWQLYPDVVSMESRVRKPIKPDPVKQYGGLWYYADPWGRPDDRIVVLEGRFDGRGKVSFDLLKHFCVSKPAFAEAVVRKDQIEIRFNGVEYAGQNPADKTMSYSLLYHEGDLLGQVFREGMEPEKVVMRRPDITMANQIISFLARDNRELQTRIDREQTQAAGEKLALKNNIQSLEETNGQLRSENSDLSALLNRARKEIEDMRASWDRAKEEISELQRELAEVRQVNRELSDQKQQVLKTVQALEDMLRQARVTKQD